MKTRIIQNSIGEYLVQKKYKYRPFWIDDIVCNSGGYRYLNWFDIKEKAMLRREELQEINNYKKIYKIVKD